MGQYIIREMRPEEYPLLRDFLYASIFRKEGEPPLPFEVVNEPELRAYYADFGKPDDHAIAAELDGRVVGAVWARIICGDVKGYGNVDEETPEFAIAINKECRGTGIGTALMRAMLDHLRARGYRQTSLSVQKENRAARLYERLGFKVVSDHPEEYIMVYSFD